MNYKRDVPAALSHPPEHGIRPTPFPVHAAQRMIPRRASGWDPYEVWRTRVKAPRVHADEALDNALDKAG
jgi:hypothetical protein